MENIFNMSIGGADCLDGADDLDRGNPNGTALKMALSGGELLNIYLAEFSRGGLGGPVVSAPGVPSLRSGQITKKGRMQMGADEEGMDEEVREGNYYAKKPRRRIVDNCLPLDLPMGIVEQIFSRQLRRLPF